MKVDVYWNLHKNLWSVRHKGKVIAHMGSLALQDVTFRVQPAGRARVRKEGKKNVHAFASGTYNFPGSSELLRSVNQDHSSVLVRRITYNPYQHESFVYTDDLTPVHKTDRVVLSGRNVWEVVNA